MAALAQLVPSALLAPLVSPDLPDTLVDLAQLVPLDLLDHQDPKLRLTVPQLITHQPKPTSLRQYTRPRLLLTAHLLNRPMNHQLPATVR